MQIEQQALPDLPQHATSSLHNTVKQALCHCQRQWIHVAAAACTATAGLACAPGSPILCWSIGRLLAVPPLGCRTPTPDLAPCRVPFEEVAERQLAATVDQLLLAYGVPDAPAWSPIIARLAEEAAAKLSPAEAVAFGNLDPRFYIKARLFLRAPSPPYCWRCCSFGETAWAGLHAGDCQTGDGSCVKAISKQQPCNKEFQGGSASDAESEPVACGCSIAGALTERAALEHAHWNAEDPLRTWDTDGTSMGEGRSAPMAQVKKVPGVGTPGASCVCDGVACRKNLAHKRMRRRVAAARILMVAGTLEFGRAQGRLASLDSFTKAQVRAGGLAALRVGGSSQHALFCMHVAAAGPAPLLAL